MEARLGGDLSHLLDHMGQSPRLEPDRANSSNKHIGTLQRNAAHPWSIHGMFAESGVQHEVTRVGEGQGQVFPLPKGNDN